MTRTLRAVNGDGIDGDPLPNNITAEQVVLGAAMLSPAALADARAVLDGGEFYRPAHQVIWTLDGQIVLSIGCDTKSDGDLGAAAEVGTDPASVKFQLDEPHKRKIDLADYVLVLNAGGYTGASTRSEIAYAAPRGKPVHYLTAPAGDAQ